ncbi:MAG: hypothetical protein ACE5HN_03095 [Nitrospiria bacterium]
MKPCPACDHVVHDEETQCPFCGVVYEKWKALLLEQKIRPYKRTLLTGIAIHIFCTFYLIWTLPSFFFPLIGMILGCVVSRKGLAGYARVKGRDAGWDALALLPVVGPMIGLIVLTRSHDLSYTEDQPGRSYFSSFVTAIILYLVDAIILNQGGIAVITALFVIFILLPKILFAALKKDSALLAESTVKAAIYTVMVVAIITSVILDNKRARHRAEGLVDAARQYEATHGRLPDKLQDLVPEFIPEIPSAKSGFMYSYFRYISSKGHHELIWVDFPPHDDAFYLFETDRWGFMVDSPPYERLYEEDRWGFMGW